MPYNYLTQNSLPITVTGVLTLQDGGYSPMYTGVTWWWTTTSQLDDTIIQVNAHTVY